MVVEVKVVNLVTIAQTALERFDSGEGGGVVVLSDSASKDGITVVPRKWEEPVEEVRESPWTFETSSFAGYRRDNVENSGVANLDCFDLDWKMSKLQSYVKSPEERDKVR